MAAGGQGRAAVDPRGSGTAEEKEQHKCRAEPGVATCMEGEWPSSRLTGHSTLTTKAQALRQSCNLSCIVSLPNRNRVPESQRAVNSLVVRTESSGSARQEKCGIIHEGRHKVSLELESEFQSGIPQRQEPDEKLYTLL